MTLDTNISKTIFHGNGVATTFPFAFKVWSADQLTVTVTMPDATEQTEEDVTAQCSISLTESGGSVVYLREGSPLPAGAVLSITRDMPFVQEVDLVSASRFDPQVIEDALDQAAAERQQLREGLSRAVKTPATSATTPEDMVEDIFDARDQAEQSATGAAASATAAANSATAAASSATTASQEATTAADSATTASQKATAAAGSATAAADSATAAADSATAAASSETAAKASEDQAFDYASQALDSAGKAQNYAAQSLDYAGQSLSSAQAAATSATAALVSEGSAATNAARAEAAAEIAENVANPATMTTPGIVRPVDGGGGLIIDAGTPGRIRVNIDGETLQESNGQLFVPTASTSVTGVVRLATSAETKSMTSDAQAVTPSGLAAASTSAATANSIARRNASGRLQVADPSAGADAVTKQYVDGTLAYTNKSTTPAFQFIMVSGGKNGVSGSGSAAGAGGAGGSIVTGSIPLAHALTMTIPIVCGAIAGATTAFGYTTGAAVTTAPSQTLPDGFTFVPSAPGGAAATTTADAGDGGGGYTWLDGWTYGDAGGGGGRVGNFYGGFLAGVGGQGGGSGGGGGKWHKDSGNFSSSYYGGNGGCVGVSKRWESNQPYAGTCLVYGLSAAQHAVGPLLNTTFSASAYGGISGTNGDTIIANGYGYGLGGVGGNGGNGLYTGQGGWGVFSVGGNGGNGGAMDVDDGNGGNGGHGGYRGGKGGNGGNGSNATTSASGNVGGHGGCGGALPCGGAGGNGGAGATAAAGYFYKSGSGGGGGTLGGGGGGGGGGAGAGGTFGAGSTGVFRCRYPSKQPLFSGGEIYKDGTYIYHTFYVSGTLQPIAALTFM